MDVFSPVYPPSVQNTRKTVTPRVISNQFGDGYSQDIPDGLNVSPRKITANWQNLYPSDAQYIEDFMDAHAGVVFLWTAPRETVQRKWICKSYDRLHPDPGLDTMYVTLEERFSVSS